MTPTTLALVERLANDASSGNGAMLIGVDEAARFFALAMEHARKEHAMEVFAVRLSAETGDDDRGVSGWLETAEEVIRTGDLSLARTDQGCAAAIREAGK